MGSKDKKNNVQNLTLEPQMKNFEPLKSFNQSIKDYITLWMRCKLLLRGFKWIPFRSLDPPLTNDHIKVAILPKNWGGGSAEISSSNHGYGENLIGRRHPHKISTTILYSTLVGTPI